MQKKFNGLYAEIDWPGNEYRSFTDESNGLFYVDKSSKDDTPRPIFRLESELKFKNEQNM